MEEQGGLYQVAIRNGKITKDRCSDFNQQRPPLTEGGLPVVYDQMHIQKMRHIKNVSYTYYQWLHQAPVVQTLDSAIRRLNNRGK